MKVYSGLLRSDEKTKLRPTAVCQNTGRRTSDKLINFIEQQNKG